MWGKICFHVNYIVPTGTEIEKPLYISTQTFYKEITDGDEIAKVIKKVYKVYLDNHKGYFFKNSFLFPRYTFTYENT